MIEAIVQVIGWIVIVSLSVAASGFGIAAVLDHIRSAASHRLTQGVDHEIRRRGERMSHQAYWFDTPEKRAIWRACAAAMMQGSYPDAQRTRDHDYPRFLQEELDQYNLRNAESTARAQS